MDLLFSNRVPKVFTDKVISISNKLAIDPNWLMFLMDWESGLDSSRTNPYGCSGLIQFCADFPGGTYKTINGQQYSLQTIRMMAPEAQLDVVYEYLKEVQRNNGKFADYYQLYFAILFPKAYEQPNEYVLDTSTNNIFDLNKNGQITVGEVKQYLDNRVKLTVPTAYWPVFFKKKTSFSSTVERSYSGALLPC